MANCLHFKVRSFVAPKHQNQWRLGNKLQWKRLSEKRFPFSFKETEKKRKAQRKGFRALNKFSFSSLFLL